MAYLRKRKFTNLTELIELTEEYFEEEPFIMVETYYKYIGVYKQDVYNWKNEKAYPSKKYRSWLKVVNEAKTEIHLYLARVIAHGKTESELKHTRAIKAKGNGNTVYDIHRPDPKVLALYMKSRFKDDWGEEVKDTSDSKITINLVNEGNNAIK